TAHAPKIFTPPAKSWPAIFSAPATSPASAWRSAPSSDASPANRQPLMQRADALAEADRILHICNACRYCEGYCAVFPAMERRLDFSHGDLRYLANLCHNCNECYHACQYAPPHEFAVDVPQTLAAVRTQ